MRVSANLGIGALVLALFAAPIGGSIGYLIDKNSVQDEGESRDYPNTAAGYFIGSGLTLGTTAFLTASRKYLFGDGDNE